MELRQDQERCLESLIWSIQQLEGNVDMSRLTKSAELIIQTMTGPWRFFHTPNHIFEVGETGDAIEVLAALFHDLVYVQVDQGVGVNISSYISPFVKEISGQLVIRSYPELDQDPLFELVARIFGFVSGQGLSPMAGQNEFLSAVIAVKALEDLVPASVLAQIVTCIEATIPFRPRSETGQTASERLYERLRQVNEQFNFGWSEEDTIKVVQRSVRLANRDVENFAYPASADFLDNTWNLLPETNHDLTNTNSYTVHGYRASLQKMEGFMNFLKPELVFQRFKGEPDDETYQLLITRTGKNLEIARLYLGFKLLSIAVVEALARRIGRDIPLSTMMGELPANGAAATAQLEYFLPDIPLTHPPETVIEAEVLQLLEKGRSQSSSYDIKNSPVATFIVKSVGFTEARRLLLQAKEFFKGAISPEEFLASCDPQVVKVISDGVLQLFESRKASLSNPVNHPSSCGSAH